MSDIDQPGSAASMVRLSVEPISRGEEIGDLISEPDSGDDEVNARPNSSLLSRVLVPLSLGLLALVAIGTSRDFTSSASLRHATALASQCAATGENCQTVHSCCSSGDTCYVKNEFWASCKATCDTETKDELDGVRWTCDVLSDGESGDHDEGASAGEAALPKCTNMSDAACLKEKCSVSDGGPAGDCLKTWCCSMPGTQCYKQNEWWASCKQTCEKGSGKDAWSCEELGPRTPGDPHSWQPCPRSEAPGKYPLLIHGDVSKAWDAAEERAQELLQKLELDDKVALCRGQNDPWPNDRHGYAGYVNPNFNFRNKCAMPLTLNDGPQGYNHYQQKLAGTTTQFPCLLAVAASFDPEVSRDYAEAIAAEFVAKGANVMLGPDIEVGRNPLSGRSFESLSGEDPFLGSKLVEPFVRETLGKGIIVTVKHWLDNNEEDFRMTMNVNVSERAQHEIYMPVFKAAIDAGAGAVMCAYNKVYGVSACENRHLLKKLLREDLGFRGFVMSDWGATHDAERSAKQGLDMEMPGGADDKFHKLAALVKAGKLSEKVIDEMAGHVLAAMFASGHFDGQFKYSSGEAALDTNVTSDQHRAVARKTITDSAVLLKNANEALPLQATDKKIALVGKYCKSTADSSYGQGDVFSGGGSGWVMTDLTVSPLAGIKAHFKHAEVTWGTTVAAAKDADVAVVCAAGHAEEGWDKANLTLPQALEMVSALRKASPHQKIVVLAIVPGAVTTEWLEQADAALALFMPGEQVGPAVAQLLDGSASPGGRLPVSFPLPMEPRFTQQQYPGLPFNDVNMTAAWTEGVLVGYRWNDAKQKPSALPFGFGLAYTTFKFEHFAADCKGPIKARISFQVVNTGRREGVAVPQLYVGFRSLRPVVRQLRGFKKVRVSPGAATIVSFDLDERDWRVWDEAMHAWASAVDRGEVVTVSVGTSSADIQWSHDLRCLLPSEAMGDIRVLS